jgi:hypothetical protein
MVIIVTVERDYDPEDYGNCTNSYNCTLRSAVSTCTSVAPIHAFDDNCFITFHRNVNAYIAAAFGAISIYMSYRNHITISGDNTTASSIFLDAWNFPQLRLKLQSLSISRFSTALSLTGVTISNCTGEYYEAIFLQNITDISIKDCNLIHNEGTFGGAIALWSNDNVLVERCIFANNVAEFGGALAAYAVNWLTLNNNTFYFNSAVYSNASVGGAIVLGGMYAVLSNNIFASNVGYTGGALYILKDQYIVNIVNDVYWSNSAILNGGTISVASDYHVYLKDSLFVSNHVRQYGGVY